MIVPMEEVIEELSQEANEQDWNYSDDQFEVNHTLICYMHNYTCRYICIPMEPSFLNINFNTIILMGVVYN